MNAPDQFAIAAVKCAFVSSHNSPIVRAEVLPWGEVSAMLGAVQIGEKGGRGWIPADIQPGARKLERVASISVLVLDVEAHATVDKATGTKTVDGPEPPYVDLMIAEIELSGWACILHTSHSHTEEHPRYRLTFALSRPMNNDEIKPLGLHVASLLGIDDSLDSRCLEGSRFFFLPRCPADRFELFRHAEVLGEPIDVPAMLAQIKREAEALKAASKPNSGNSGSVIVAFNDAYSIAPILAKHGYVQHRNRWAHPASTTGMAAVRRLPKSNPERIYSSHGCGDLLADDKAHDAFDCFRILDCHGDVKIAVREAARVMGMGHTSQQAPQADSQERLKQVPGKANDEAAGADSESVTWPDPQPLAAKVEPEDYPIDALPEIIRAAVEEVAAFVKAPLAMVVSSALGALSLACQAHVDVKRAERLTGPVGLFLLTLGDSGERKSTCDQFFVSAIRDYEAAQAELMKPEIERFEAEIDAWSAEREGLLSKIKERGKAEKPTDDLRASLTQLQHDKPEEPRVPRLLLGDETPENLAWGLAKRWPSAGVISSEAGQILGAHGMGKDSVMRNLALLNTLWDGGEHSVGRRTSESFVVRGARLTVALQIQEPTLRSFFDKSGALARGTGFLARFLVAWPESTQGNRPFSDPPEHWPRLARFHRRIAEILNQAALIDERGALTPQMLSLTPDAKTAWIEYHNAVEAQLRSGGELYDVRDVASKSADNAVRLAALLHVFEHGFGPVGLESFEGASLVAAWHLYESRRFFGELALPAELADAVRQDTWLIGHCRRERTHMVGKNYARQHGPLRDGARLDAAIKELADLDRLRVRKDGKRITILVNPALIGIAS
jgi:hypothetical protein